MEKILDHIERAWLIKAGTSNDKDVLITAEADCIGTGVQYNFVKYSTRKLRQMAIDVVELMNSDDQASIFHRCVRIPNKPKRKGKGDKWRAVPV